MFDRILTVDWSAKNGRALGADSIWLADTTDGEIALLNCATRAEAVERIGQAIADELAAGRRIFVGFDFVFGYPVDARALPGGGRWEAVWKHLADQVEDGDDNRSNRFAVAANLNKAFEGDGPFWGYPHQHHGRYGELPFRRPDYERLGVRERRTIDRAAKAGSPPWKLAGAGSVGSQGLLGIARLQALRERFGDALAVWPFETAFADRLDAKIVLAEIYPSLWPVDPSFHAVKDACQVATLARGFARYRDRGAFPALLDGPRREHAGAREAALTHEAWMVGFADEALPL